MKLRESHLKEAYMVGVRLALKEAGVSLLGQDATAYVEPAKDPDTEILKNVLKGKLNKKVVLKDKLTS